MRGIESVPAGCKYVRSREQLSSSELERAESLAYEHGEAYDAYLLLEKGRQYFFSSEGRGIIGFDRWRKHAYIVGGLLAPPEEKAQLLSEFLAFAKINKLRPIFINVLKNDRELFREHGYLYSKIGEEPIINLDAVNWRGKRYEWVRRQENFCHRGDVAFREVAIDTLEKGQRQQLVDALMRVSDEHVQATAFGRELTLTVARVDFDQMYRRRLFVAECDGTPVAFVIANPAHAGQMWAVETYRKGNAAPRGVIPFLIMRVARQLQSEGVPFLSLCQVPTLRAADCTHTDSALVRFGMRTWWNYVPWLYDPPRQYHFKSRFRPDYRECFVATPQDFQLLPFVAFALRWGVAWPDFKRLPGHMWGRMRKWSHSEQLADPTDEQYELIDDLRLLIAESGRSPVVDGPRQAVELVSRRSRDVSKRDHPDDPSRESYVTVSTTLSEPMTAAS